MQYTHTYTTHACTIMYAYLINSHARKIVSTSMHFSFNKKETEKFSLVLCLNFSLNYNCTKLKKALSIYRTKYYCMYVYMYNEYIELVSGLIL